MSCFWWCLLFLLLFLVGVVGVVNIIFLIFLLLFFLFFFWLLLLILILILFTHPEMKRNKWCLRNENSLCLFVFFFCVFLCHRISLSNCNRDRIVLTLVLGVNVLFKRHRQTRIQHKDKLDFTFKITKKGKKEKEEKMRRRRSNIKRNQLKARIIINEEEEEEDNRFLLLIIFIIYMFFFVFFLFFFLVCGWSIACLPACASFLKLFFFFLFFLLFLWHFVTLTLFKSI